MNSLTPKKALGQHWLHDDATLESICESAHVKPGDNVLEIGPGLGTLTAKLLEKGSFVTAVEFDHELAVSLVNNLTHSTNSQNSQWVVPIKEGVIQNLTVVEGDIMKFNLQQLPEDYKVVANIPYYLTSNLIRILCESPNPPSHASLLIQKEVAERVCASPGDMSLLSVSAQFYCEVSLGIFVPKTYFTPPPKVDSQVLELAFRKTLLFQDVDIKDFFRIVKAGFSQKRKTLLNSLSGGLAIPKDDVKAWLKRADISENTRAQMLSLDDWHNLYVTK